MRRRDQIKPLRVRKWLHRSMKRPPNEDEAIYLAGLTDGEGCFDIYGRYYPRFRIKMNSPLVKELYDEFGGGLYQYRQRSGNYAYQWEIERPEILKSLISGMLPFLREKRLQAELMLKALETKDKEELKRLKEEISGLNQKRFPPDPLFYSDEVISKWLKEESRNA